MVASTSLLHRYLINVHQPAFILGNGAVTTDSAGVVCYIILSELACSEPNKAFNPSVVNLLLEQLTFVFRQLPQATATQTAQLQIPESTADKQITQFLNAGLLIKQAHGCYAKKDN